MHPSKGIRLIVKKLDSLVYWDVEDLVFFIEGVVGGWMKRQKKEFASM